MCLPKGTLGSSPRVPVTETLFSFPGGSDGKASAGNAGDPGLIPGSQRFPGEENGNPLQYSWAFLVAQDSKESACSAGDLASIPRLERFPGGGHGNSF